MNWRIKRIFLIIIFLSFFVGCDQSSKHIVKLQLSYAPAVLYLNGFIKLIYVENPGGMLSLGAQLPPAIKFITLVIGVSIFLTLLSLYLVLNKVSRIKQFSILLIISGGLGNLIDRIFNNGRVVDFIVIGFSSFHTAIFNFADLFIITGICLFALAALRNEISKRQSLKQDIF